MRTDSAFVGTREVTGQHAFDVLALSEWLTARMDGFGNGREPLQVRIFKGGQSNPTYKLRAGAKDWVMRAKPGPIDQLLPSAHAIEREFEVMRRLQGSEVPVPRVHVLCEDESVIGRAFYIMEYLEGRVMWNPALPTMTRLERGAIYDEANRVISALHRVPFAECGLSSYGKPSHYFERQIARWSRQYLSSVTQSIPEMDRLIEWLPVHIPPSASAAELTCVVHGDFRLDNLMMHPTEPRTIAVLDWELSTLGHPLADFSYHCMAWHISPGLFRGIAGLDLEALGIPSEAQFIRRYCERTGFTSPDALAQDWNFYLAYNLFRLAAILQGIGKRVEMGTASSAQARDSATGARPLAELAWSFAQRS